MADPFVAEIRMFPFNFAPKGWAWCNGQIMPISQNTALFSLLGTVYGGDGKSTFALPDLMGRSPLMPNDNNPSNGLSTRDLGEIGGSDFVQLLVSEMPAHTHQLRASGEDADDDDPPGAALAGSIGVGLYRAPDNNMTTMAFQALPPAGGSAPHNNLMPYLTVYFCIALQGVFPPRQ